VRQTVGVPAAGVVDVTLEFEVIEGDVAMARRGTTHCGGVNFRPHANQGDAHG